MRHAQIFRASLVVTSSLKDHSKIRLVGVNLNLERMDPMSLYLEKKT